MNIKFNIKHLLYICIFILFVVIPLFLFVMNFPFHTESFFDLNCPEGQILDKNNNCVKVCRHCKLGYCKNGRCNSPL